jgi:ribose/xylose/arabinose/galactoside ABC-type transport system permease subunit
MQPLLVLFVAPVFCGFLASLLFHRVRVAFFVATLAAPTLIFAVVKVMDPHEPWSAFATMLMSPLAIALAVITVFLCSGRKRVRSRRRWQPGKHEEAGA